MKVLVLIISLCVSALVRAQSTKVVMDSVSQKSIVLSDSIHKTVSWAEVTDLAKQNTGWRLPTVKELKAIYESTYDRSRLRSVVAPGSYYTSDYQAGGIGDTVRILGLMMGREFKAILPQGDYNNLLLVKDL